VNPLRDNSGCLPPNAPERYGGVAIALHWLIAVLILSQIAFGWCLEEIPRGTPMRGFYVNLHKSTGLTIALLIVLRLGWRLAHPPPQLPPFVPAWERVASRINHLALYICMLVMPSSGYIASNFSKFGIKLFNVILLPPWGIDDRRIYAVFNTTHVATSYLFVGFIALHVFGAVRHAVRRDGLFARMLPLRSCRQR
jgi:cytochrome b561